MDAATGAVTINVPGGSYSAAIVSIRNVPAVVPQGIKVRSDGRATIVTSGAAIDLAPNAFGLIEFIAAARHGWVCVYTKREWLVCSEILAMAKPSAACSAMTT